MTGVPLGAAGHQTTPRPPLVECFAYRTLGWKLDARYHQWIAEDVRSGRALRWRWLTCGVMIVGTQLLIRAAFVARGAPSTPVTATLVGGLIGLVVGSQIVKRQDPEARVAKYLRYQSLLPDGRQDPNPRGFARLNNYGVAAVQLASVAFLGVVAGYVPVRVIPIPSGRCVAPTEASLSAIRRALQPGVEIRSLRAVRHRGVTFIAGTTSDDQAVSWKQIKALGGIVQGAGSVAGTVTPALGVSTFGGGDTQSYDDALQKAEACSSAASQAGDRAPRLLVRTPNVQAALGSLRIEGASTFDLVDLTATCTGNTSAVVLTGTGELALLVSSPQLFLSVLPAGAAPTVYTGTIGVVENRIVIIDGKLGSAGPRTSPTVVRITGRIPCNG